MTGKPNNVKVFLAQENQKCLNMMAKIYKGNL